MVVCAGGIEEDAEYCGASVRQKWRHSQSVTWHATVSCVHVSETAANV
jgi:hypothetical protein